MEEKIDSWNLLGTKNLIEPAMSHKMSIFKVRVNLQLSDAVMLVF
jgi:hypothetical protein